MIASFFHVQIAQTVNVDDHDLFQTDCLCNCCILWSWLMISGSVPSDQNLLINIINTMIATSDQKKRNYQYNQHNGLTPVVPEISRDPATQVWSDCASQTAEGWFQKLPQGFTKFSGLQLKQSRFSAKAADLNSDKHPPRPFLGCPDGNHFFLHMIDNRLLSSINNVYGSTSMPST